MNELLVSIGYGFLANCCFYTGCLFNRIGRVLFWLLKKTYGTSDKLFDMAIRFFDKDKGEKHV